MKSSEEASDKCCVVIDEEFKILMLKEDEKEVSSKEAVFKHAENLDKLAKNGIGNKTQNIKDSKDSINLERS